MIAAGSLRAALGSAAAIVFATAGALGACGPAAAPTPAAPSASVAAAPPAKLVQLNAPGAAVDVLAALPAGYVTVVDFWSVTCEPCKTFGAMLEAGVADEPRVVIRKVDVGDGDTPVAEAYKIGALPHFFVYDKLRRLRYDLVGPDCGQASEYARQLASE